MPTGGGRPVNLPFYDPIDQNGDFTIELPAGNYKVTITDCNFLGCSQELPKFINVSANKIHELMINLI